LFCRTCRAELPGEPEEIPREGGGRKLTGNGAYGDSKLAGASQGLRRGGRRPY